MSNIHERATEILRSHPSQRPGQAYYNAARSHPDAQRQLDMDAWLQENVDGTDIDPFNVDARLPAFLTLWHEHWELLD